MTTVYKFKAYYTDAGVGTAQDPAPVCTVINMADDSKLADAQATTASTNMPGLYSYEYSGADGLDVVAFFATTDTGCDVKQLASYVSEKITTNLNADVAGVETKLDTVDANVDAILADTGTDGVVLKAAGLAEDAVTEIQTGLALEATLTAIKGAGWSTETLKIIRDALTTAQADLDNPNQYKADVSALTNVTLSAAGVDAILDEVVVGSYTMRQLLTVMAAAMAGKVSGGGTSTITFRGVDDASNVIVATVDASGNRSAVTLTV